MLETELNDAENEPGRQGSAETAGQVVNPQAAGTPAADAALTPDRATPADPAPPADTTQATGTGAVAGVTPTADVTPPPDAAPAADAASPGSAPPEAGTTADDKRRARTGRTRRASTRATRPAGPPSEIPPPAAVSAAATGTPPAAPAQSGTVPADLELSGTAPADPGHSETMPAAPAQSGTVSADPEPAQARAAGTAAAVPPPVPAVPPFGGAEPTSNSAPRRSAAGVAPAGFSAAEPPAQAAPAAFLAPQIIFQAPEAAAAESAAAGAGSADGAGRQPGAGRGDGDEAEAPVADGDGSGPEAESSGEEGGRRRRRRGGRGRSKGRADDNGDDDGQQPEDGAAASDDASAAEDTPTGAEAADETGAESAADTPARRRRRRRRRGGAQEGDQPAADDPPDTVVHVREPRPASSARAKAKDEVQGLKGSTRLEAKKQRRREGRDSGRRRPPIITESEFLARREAVDRAMVVRQRGDRTQIAVLEDGVLVEHYVDKSSHQSFVGNVYLGKVQNVLPSMEAAFVDIGKGRNAVLYAGEVNFDASGLDGQTRRIESALKSGQSVLVQVTKDPIGHKGARLTSQVSLPGRYLVYVPGASMTGISRKLPDTERNRLKQILKKVMPEGAGVIVRTAAEGATEDELAQDVARLAAQWENIESKAKTASPPELLYSEPDLTIRVVRDIFNEDFSSLVVSGDDGWDMVDEYVRYVAPHLVERLSRWQEEQDVFGSYRVDEQLAKALDRKVYLPSGGSLVIDRTEAMTVIDVNTGKFTGQGGNLEETVTRNNLEAAEEIVRQLRLRDVGGIIVIDFIDMVLESNRELVLRRLLECLARDRTKHQVAEVTSLGLVQMTRKRVGSGLLEAFSVTCECCNGRGLHVSLEPAELASAGHRRRGDDKPAADGQAAANGGNAAKSGNAGKGGSAGKDSNAAKSGSAGKDGNAGKGGNAADGASAAKDGNAADGGNGDEDRPAGGGRRRRRKPAAAAADGKPAENANGNQERAGGPPAADSEESEGIPAV
jgi:ribonuclease E